MERLEGLNALLILMTLAQNFQRFSFESPNRFNRFPVIDFVLFIENRAQKYYLSRLVSLDIHPKMKINEKNLYTFANSKPVDKEGESSAEP